MLHPRDTDHSPRAKQFFACFIMVEEAAVRSQLQYHPLGIGAFVVSAASSKNTPITAESTLSSPEEQHGPLQITSKTLICTAEIFHIALTRPGLLRATRVLGATSLGGKAKPHARHASASSQKMDI